MIWGLRMILMRKRMRFSLQDVQVRVFDHITLLSLLFCIKLPTDEHRQQVAAVQQ